MRSISGSISSSSYSSSSSISSSTSTASSNASSNTLSNASASTSTANAFASFRSENATYDEDEVEDLYEENNFEHDHANYNQRESEEKVPFKLVKRIRGC